MKNKTNRYIYIILFILIASYVGFMGYRIYHNTFLENFTDNIAVISCYFGNSFSFLHPAPSNFKSYFFTNYSEMKHEIEKKGWIYCERKEEISDDSLVSSIQSKKIKFLQIMSEYPELFDGKDILYIDHKIHFTNEHVNHFKNLSSENPTKELILCNNNRTNERNIRDEINEANLAERYRRHMPETIEFIRQYLVENNLKEEDTKIYMTGILYYHNISNIKQLLYDINKLCNDLQQPECQVFMSALSKKYETFIKPIEFIEVNPSLEQAKK